MDVDEADAATEVATEADAPMGVGETNGDPNTNHRQAPVAEVAEVTVYGAQGDEELVPFFNSLVRNSGPEQDTISDSF